MSVCPFVHPPVCLSVRLSVSVRPSVFLSLFVFLSPSVCLNLCVIFTYSLPSTHIPLKYILILVNHENNLKIKTNKKKQEKRKSNSHENEKSLTLPTMSTTGLEKKKKPTLVKKNISSPILQNSDGLSIASPDPGSVKG